MNIGINILYLIPGKVGGTETYATELIRAFTRLVKKNDKIIIFTGIEAESMFNKHANINVVVLPLYSNNRIVRIIAEQFLLPIYCIIYKIDTLFSLGYSSPLFHLCRSVVTIHDLNWYYHPEDFNTLNKYVWEYMTRLSAITANHIVTDSQSSADSIVNVLKISDNKITPILHGVPEKISLSHEEASIILNKLAIHRPYLFTVLAGYPHKNLVTLLKAFSKLVNSYPDLNLVVCGLGGRADESNITQIKTLNLNNKVRIMGYISRDELASLYINAKIFIFPSAYEGFGYPVVEAMSYGTPVISSNAASLREVVGIGGILVDTFNVKDYVEAASKLLSNAEYRSKMVKAGNSRIKQLSWHKTANLMYNLAIY